MQKRTHAYIYMQILSHNTYMYTEGAMHESLEKVMYVRTCMRADAKQNCVEAVHPLIRLVHGRSLEQAQRTIGHLNGEMLLPIRVILVYAGRVPKGDAALRSVTRLQEFLLIDEDLQYFPTSLKGSEHNPEFLERFLLWMVIRSTDTTAIP